MSTELSKRFTLLLLEGFLLLEVFLLLEGFSDMHDATLCTLADSVGIVSFDDPLEFGSDFERRP
jgi:hypothetical protein